MSRNDRGHSRPHPLCQRSERLLGRRHRMRCSGRARRHAHHGGWRISARSGSRRRHPRAGRHSKSIRAMASSSACSITKPCGPPERSRIERYLASEIKGVGPALRAQNRRAFRRLRSPKFSTTRRSGCVKCAGWDPTRRDSHRDRMARFVGAARADGFSARARHRRGARAADPQVLRQGRARGRTERSLRPRAHHLWHRISHRRCDRGETRHPAQLDSARPRRDRLPARAHGRRRPRLFALRISRTAIRERPRNGPRPGARALEELQKSGEVVVEEADEHTAVYLKRLHEAEVNVAKRIAN